MRFESLSSLHLELNNLHVEANQFGCYRYFPSTAVVCGSVLPLRGSCPPGGHRQRLRFPQPQIQPAEEQQEHRLLQRQTHTKRGEMRRRLLLNMWLLKGVFVSPNHDSFVRSWLLNIHMLRCTLVSPMCGRWTSKTLLRWKGPSAPSSARR